MLVELKLAEERNPSKCLSVTRMHTMHMIINDVVPVFA